MWYNALALGLPHDGAAALLVDAMHRAGPASPAVDFHSRPSTPTAANSSPCPGPTRQQQQTQPVASKAGTNRCERSEGRTAHSPNNTHREGSTKRPSEQM